MSAALITAITIGLGGLVYSAFLGYTIAASADLLTHTTLGIFFTLLTLLAHSMTMFYLIGKGKAVREAVTEGNLSRDLCTAVVHARRPVFSIATVAMLLTMVAALLGGGVDTGTLPVGVHALFALSAIAANGMALRTELSAMIAISRIVVEVDTQLAASK